MNFTARHYHSSRSRVAFILFASSLIVLMTSARTAAQRKPGESRALYNSERVTTVRRGNMIDVARSNLFTDFSDTINSTVGSGTIFNNSSTGTNGGYFHLGTSAADAYWGAASSTGGSPFGTIANSAIYFGNRDNVPLQFLTSSISRMIIAGGGNVGIGTTNPTSLFQVLGNTSNSALIQLRNQNTTAGTSYGMFVAGGTNSSDYVLALRDAADNDLVRVLGNGNFGIGTVSPGFKLQVEGIIYSNGAENSSPSSGNFLYTPGTWNGLRQDSSTHALYINTYNLGTRLDAVAVLQNGNVGIGTTSPYTKLQIAGGDISIDADHAIRKAGDNSIIAYSSSLPGIAIGSGSATDQVVINAGGYERARILTNGNVGIGTPSPGDYKLNVNGDTNVKGNLNIAANGAGTGNIVAAGTINARYQDVAEWVPASEQLSAGTVVVLDSTKSNQVTSSTLSYDTRVAGVISEQPGIALGEKSDGKVLVATTGRVRVKVDATKSPIHIGDLLVTSDIPGLAMKSEPVEFAGRKMHMPGTLIGKALEPLENGKGEILVLLSLQ